MEIDKHFVLVKKDLSYPTITLLEDAARSCKEAIGDASETECRRQRPTVATRDKTEESFI